MKYVIALIIILAALVGLMILTKPKPSAVPDPPCEELIWMRDSPQARCVQYWRERNLKEQQDEQVL